MDMEKKYYCIHDWMTKDLGLRGSERDVFAVIYSFAETCGAFTGGLQYLCRRTGASKTTVMECLRRLLTKDLLIKTERLEKGVKLCAYRINPGRITPYLTGAETGPGAVKKPDCPGAETEPGAVKKPDCPGAETEPGAVKKLVRPGTETEPNNKVYNKDDTKGYNKECVAPPPKEPFRKYGEYANVKLTDRELEALKRDYPDDWRQRVDRLSEYMASTGKKYQNHLATIRSWARQDDPKPVKKGLYADLKGGIEL